MDSSAESRAVYGSDVPAGSGGRVAVLADDSAASRAGMAVGDCVLSADGAPLADIIDWQWYSDGDQVALELLRAESGTLQNVLLVREPGQPWGFEFADVIFDRVRTCRNSCAFCFMSQLPKGLRPALYLRDDDFRLSFLSGNFISLTNLTDADVTRIGEQQLSPLYVSLHAVDPEVRSRLICAHEDRALERFDQLLAEGIELHVQIVLVPGANDGEQLDRTLTWLAKREGVASVGIVPLGYTRHQNTFAVGYEDRIDAAMVIEQVQRWQFAMRERDELTWVHLADEFYLNARAPFPKTEWYDEFPQYENGIGMVRSFVDEAMGLRAEITAALAMLPADQDSVTLITGVMAATTLAGALEACEGIGRVRLLAVGNRFFGGNVSVTGLLAGIDILDAIAKHPHDGVHLLPDVVFNADGLTLDDMTLTQIAEQSGADIRLVSCTAGGLLLGLVSAAPDTDQK